MQDTILSTSEKMVIVGTKLTPADAAAIKIEAARYNFTVSKLVRIILLEWMGRDT